MQAHFYTDSNNENSTFRINQNNFFSNNSNASRMDNNISSANPRRRLIKQGWLYKRAEHMKTWRSRYFVLYENGDFLGFKSQQESAPDRPNEPLNNFTVLNCQVLKTEKPRAHSFILRGTGRAAVSLPESERFVAPENIFELTPAFLQVSSGRRPSREPSPPKPKSSASNGARRSNMSHFCLAKRPARTSNRCRWTRRAVHCSDSGTWAPDCTFLPPRKLQVEKNEL